MPALKCRPIIGSSRWDADNGAPSHAEEHADQLLRQPDRLILHPHLDGVLARLLGEDQELGGAVANLELAFFFHG